MKEFFDHLIGADANITALSAWGVWAFIGLVISLYMDFTSSGSAHKEMNWKYFWNDNNTRIILSLVLIPVALVFAPEFLGLNLNAFTAFTLGLTMDKVIETVKDRRKKKIQSNPS